MKKIYIIGGVLWAVRIYYFVINRGCPEIHSGHPFLFIL